MHCLIQAAVLFLHLCRLMGQVYGRRLVSSGSVGIKNARIYAWLNKTPDGFIHRQGLVSSVIQLEIQACFTTVFLKLRKTPVCSISLVIVIKIKESIGHMI